jgi:hypothetical protein
MVYLTMTLIFRNTLTITSGSWALLEVPQIVQLLKIFTAFYGTRRFIIVYITALHWFLSWARPIQSTPPHSILSSHLHLWSSQWSPSFWISHQYPIWIPLLPHSCYMPRPSHPSWRDYSNYPWWRIQVMKFLIIFPNLLSLHPSLVRIFSSTSCSQTSSVYVPPSRPTTVAQSRSLRFMNFISSRMGRLRHTNIVLFVVGRSCVLRGLSRLPWDTPEWIGKRLDISSFILTTKDLSLMYDLSRL